MDRIRQEFTSAPGGARNAAKPIPPVFVVLLLFIMGGFPIHARPQEPGMLVEELARRLEAYPKYENWTFRSVSINREMTKNWTPKKTTVLEKSIRVSGGAITEEILRATEEENGRTKDITQDRIKKAEERKRKAEKERAGRERRGIRRGERGGSIYSIGLEEVFPFKEEKRNLYNFSLLEGSEIGGRPVLALKSSAKSKDEDLLEGVYYIDKESLIILKASLRPSKIPKIIKDFAFELSFDVLPSGHFVLRNIRMKVNGGIFIKHIRMEVEETYKDYEILN